MENREIEDIFDTLIRSAVIKKTKEELATYEGAALYPSYVESERYQQLIDKYRRKDERKKLVGNAYKAAAILLVTLLTATSIGLATVQAFRERVFGIMKIITDDTIIFVKEDADYQYIPLSKFIKDFRRYFPLDDFPHVEESLSDAQIFYKYTNDDSGYITFLQRATDANIVAITVPYGDFQKKIYNDHEIYYDEYEEGGCYVFTYDETYTYAIISSLELKTVLPLVEKILQK